MFVTINHIDEYTGFEFYRPGLKLTLKKETDNSYDDEGIAVYSDKHVKFGYVANSVCTVCRGTYSAGRLYDLFEEATDCIVRFVAERFAIAEIIEL